jgi:hypothetical protein
MELQELKSNCIWLASFMNFLETKNIDLFSFHEVFLTYFFDQIRNLIIAMVAICRTMNFWSIFLANIGF